MGYTLTPVYFAGGSSEDSAAQKDLLILGPGLGTEAGTLWEFAAAQLQQDFRLVGYELPGHGGSPNLVARAGSVSNANTAGTGAASNASAAEALSIADLADAVAALADMERAPGQRVFFAGVSLSGAIGLQLSLRHGQLFTAVAAICTAAQIGEAATWQQRAATVRAEGLQVLVEGSRQRWFAPAFPSTHPQRVAALLANLVRADAESYAQLCEALAGHDVRHSLPQAACPVLAIGGHDDAVCPPEQIRFIADTVPAGQQLILPEVAHQAPLEAPEATAATLVEFFTCLR